MNTSYPHQVPKYHRVMTVLAEVACVCLVFASILIGLADALQKAQYHASTPHDRPNGTIQTPGGASGSVSGSGEGDYSFVIINPGKTESDSTSTDSYVSGSFASGAYEAVTDENGKTYYQYYVGGSAGENGGAVLAPGGSATFIPVVPGDAVPPVEISYTSTSINLNLLLGSFLPCVLLLLYALHLYQKPNSRRQMAIIMGIYAASFLVDAVSTLIYMGRIGAKLLLQSILMPAALAMLLGVLTVMFWKGTTHRKFALATFILAWMSTGYDLLDRASYLLPGSGFPGSPLITVGHIIYNLGMLAFQVALFAYAYRKESSSLTDGSDGATGERDTVERDTVERDTVEGDTAAV